LNDCIGKDTTDILKKYNPDIVKDILLAPPKEAPRCIEKMKSDNSKDIK
jgi:hypothetical protein